ncbi:MAG: DUF1636 domain-containing protein [Pseudomonadota bacterium]
MRQIPPTPGDALQAGAAPGHCITVCTRCRRTGERCLPGYELISKLRVAVAVAQRSGLLDAAFCIDGVACMAGCDRPCTVAYRADGKGCYLFGDIEGTADIDALVAFAARYAGSDEGWTRETERPDGLAGKTLARIPCAMVIERQAPDADG